MDVMKTIAENTAASYGAKAAACGRELAEKMGLNVITPEYPNIGSDNYADFLEAFPGFYCFVGSMKEGDQVSANHHHPRFDIDERSLDISAEFMAEYAVRFLQK